MSGVAYTTKSKAAIRKKANGNAEVIITVDANTKIYISDTTKNWATLSSDHAKINGKKVAGGFISMDKIKQNSAKTKVNTKNSKHGDHIKKTLHGKLVIDAFIRGTCSDSKASGVYIAKGTKVKIKTTCTANRMYLIDKTGIKLSNGKALDKDKWINMSCVKISESAIDKLAEAATKAKGVTDKVSAKAKALNAAESAKVAREAAEQIMSIDAMGAINSSLYAEQLLIKNAQGIHGIPYQFMPNVDMRLSNNVSFGRKYVERIVSKMPLVLFTPGTADFMPSFTKNDRNNIIQQLISVNVGMEKCENALNKLLKKSGRYYTFKFAYAEYYQYVNQMLRYCSIVLGLGSVIHGTMGYSKSVKQDTSWGTITKGYSAKLKNFRWEKAVNPKLKGFTNAAEYVAFYIDSDSSISESLDNSTAASSLASAADEATQLSREIRFLVGPFAGVKIADLTSDNKAFKKSKAKVKQIANKFMGGSRLFDNIGEMFSTVAKGGKLLFPELWDDSTYTKNYTISIKLRTPDADKLSWFLNICVPLIHLLALAAPHHLSANGYSSPFLVRAYYKGIFNCDMGIITGMDITKGQEGAWSVDGLPTQVDVNITLKDLYGAFSISNEEDWKFFTNTALIDYLCNTCGVNINKMETARLLEAYSAWKTNQFKDIFPDMWLGLEQGVSNLSGSIYNRAVKKEYT